MLVRLALVAAVLWLAAGPEAMAGRRARSSGSRADEAAAPVSDSGKTVEFANACAKGDRLTIAAVGDMLFHKQLEQQALTPNGTYRDFWKPLTGVLEKADLTYANFEGAAADGVTSGLDLVKDPGREWNNRVYSSPVLTLSYNYHPSVIDDIQATGFDVVSTANNHALDRGSVGIDRTVLNMQKRGMAFTGTHAKSELDRPFSIVTRAKGLNVAWLACTFSTNGFPDNKGQVLGEIKRLAASPEIHAVILTPHWGQEGQVAPEKRQRLLAKDAIDAGATAVVGTHPHVVGPWEKIIAADGRESLAIYSTGNFISNQRKPEQRIGELALLELTRDVGAAKMRLTAAGYITTFVDITSVHRVGEAGRSQVSRVLPVGNRVFSAGLPNLPRSCGAGESVVSGWGTSPKVTVAMLPFPVLTPAEREARNGEYREPRSLPPLPLTQLVDVLPPPPKAATAAMPDAAKAPVEQKKSARKKASQASNN
jgi:Bacterial capsule synthesis protein PGA_cap